MTGQQREGGESSRSQEDDWTGVTDQLERRKIQNRNAQRKFRASSLPTSSAQCLWLMKSQERSLNGNVKTKHEYQKTNKSQAPHTQLLMPEISHRIPIQQAYLGAVCPLNMSSKQAKQRRNSPNRHLGRARLVRRKARGVRGSRWSPRAFPHPAPHLEP